MNATRVELKAPVPELVSQNLVQGFLYACTDSLGLSRGLAVVAYEFPGERVAGFYIIPDAHMSVHIIEGELLIELFTAIPVDLELLRDFTKEYFNLSQMEMN